MMRIDIQNTITLRVFRGDVEHHELVAYQVPYKPGQSVLNALQELAGQQAPDLAYSCSCRIGLCSSCMLRVDGKAVLACTTLVRDGMLIEPYKSSAVIRDLVAELPSITPKRR